MGARPLIQGRSAAARRGAAIAAAACGMLTAPALIANATGVRDLKPAAPTRAAVMAPRGLDRSLLPRVADGGRVRVTILLRDQPLLAPALEPQTVLALRGPAEAAGGGEGPAPVGSRRISRAERAMGLRAEATRQIGFGALRAPARRAELASLAFARRITGLGGRVENASLLPNSLIAVLPSAVLGRVAIDPAVRAVGPAPREELHGASSLDGSATWHANHYSAAGSRDVGLDGAAGSRDDGLDSGDGQGGPDVGVVDLELRWNHDAFSYPPPPAPPEQPANPAPSPATKKTRVIYAPPATSSAGGGSEHGNGVAAIAAGYDPFEPAANYSLGLAYGVDHLLDGTHAKSEDAWLVGFSYDGQNGASDLPEVINMSMGIRQDGDDSDTNQKVDAFASAFGIARTGSAGNKGPSYVGTPARVSSPSTAYNAISVGSVDINWTIDRRDDTAIGYSSRGPTIGGRKKPELIAYGSDACPAAGPVGDAAIDSSWKAPCGFGTSFAAPRAAAGVALLAGVGVADVAAQKAILINSAWEVDSTSDADADPETYWRPDVGWGELDLARAFEERKNWAVGEVEGCWEGSCRNNARFYAQSVANTHDLPDRTTLVWLRRVIDPYWPVLGSTSHIAYTVSDLDLFQIDEAGNSVDLFPGGVDSAEDSETDSATSPDWAADTDGQDNVEQVRTDVTGPSIVKVRATSNVVGAATERFALASANPLEPLDSPIPSLVVARDKDAVRQGERVTVTATATNPSEDLDLEDASLSIALPPGVEIAPGSPAPTSSVPLGTLARSPLDGSTRSVTWHLVGRVDGAALPIPISVDGNKYDERFGATDTRPLKVDSTPPVATIEAPAGEVSYAELPVSWSAIDSLSEIAGYDVEVQTDDGAWTPWLTNVTERAATFDARHASTYRFRVRARDTLGNISPFTESAAAEVFSLPPSVKLIGPKRMLTGSIASFTVDLHGVPPSATIEYGVNYDGVRPYLGGPIPVLALAPRDYTMIWVRIRDASGREIGGARVDINPYQLVPSVDMRASLSRQGFIGVRGSVPADARGTAVVTILGKKASTGKRFTRRRRLANISGDFATKFDVRHLKAGRYFVRVRFAGAPAGPYGVGYDSVMLRARRG